MVGLLVVCFPFERPDLKERNNMAYQTDEEYSCMKGSIARSLLAIVGDGSVKP